MTVSRTRGDRLRDVARRGDASVGDHGNPVPDRHLGDVEDGRDLRHADAGDDAGGADRAGPDAGLQAVRAGVDQRLGGLAGGDVAGDQLDVELRLDPPHHLDDRARVAVGGVDDEHVDLGCDEGRRALERVRADADGGPDPQPPALVLRRERVALALLDVLDRDQAPEAPGVVDDRQLLDLVAPEQAAPPRRASCRPAR